MNSLIKIFTVLTLLGFALVTHAQISRQAPHQKVLRKPQVATHQTAPPNRTATRGPASETPAKTDPKKKAVLPPKIHRDPFYRMTYMAAQDECKKKNPKLVIKSKPMDVCIRKLRGLYP